MVFQATKTNFHIFLPFHIHLPYLLWVWRPLEICFIPSGLLKKPKKMFKKTSFYPQVNQLTPTKNLYRAVNMAPKLYKQISCVKVLLFCPGNCFFLWCGWKATAFCAECYPQVPSTNFWLPKLKLNFIHQTFIKTKVFNKKSSYKNYELLGDFEEILVKTCF